MNDYNGPWEHNPTNLKTYLVGAFALLFLIGCNLGGGSSSADPVNLEERQPEIKPEDISLELLDEIIPEIEMEGEDFLEDLQKITLQLDFPVVPAGSHVNINALGTFPPETQKGITNQRITQFVTFTIINKSIAAIGQNPNNENEFRIYGISEGETIVYAEGGGIVSQQLNVKVIEGVCGGEINDTSSSNANGECIKVVSGREETPIETLFTFTPSLNFLEAMGYEQNESAPKINRSYSKIFGIHLPPLNAYPLKTSPEGEYGLFRNDSPHTNWEQDGSYLWNSQASIHCQTLKKLGFARREDWRRPTKDELIKLYNDYPQGELLSRFGVPLSYHYSTSTPHPSTNEPYPSLQVVNLWNGNSVAVRWTASQAGGCISNTASDIIDI